MFTFRFADGSYLKDHKFRKHPNDSTTTVIREVYWYHHWLSINEKKLKMKDQVEIVSCVEMLIEAHDTIDKLSAGHEASLTLVDSIQHYGNGYEDGPPREYTSNGETHLEIGNSIGSGDD